MAKQGMKRFYSKHNKNNLAPVPQIQGKARSTKEKARPLIAGEQGEYGKVYHGIPHSESDNIPAAFSAIDNDLAAENILNDYDMTAADMQDLKEIGC